MVQGIRRICTDVRSADAVTPIKGTTLGTDIGPLGDVPILPSHHGRGQHGCGDQPSRQNFKLVIPVSPLGTEAKTFWRLLRNEWSDRRFKLNICSRSFTAARGRRRTTNSVQGLTPPYRITISTKIAAAKMAKQLRKSTMGVPFHAIRRALHLKLQKL